MRSKSSNEPIVVPRNATPGLSDVVRAGPLLFVGGCDGHCDPDSGRIVPELSGNAKAQCENAYGRIAGLLRKACSDMDCVVRLDHATSSQDWLPIRQSVRERYFGKPAPLASTGVAARMSGINMVTACAIAVADKTDKQVLVTGPRYGMANISSAVRGGPFVFVSGIRGTTDPRTGAAVVEETPEAFEAQTRVVYAVIRSILSDCGLDADSILRIDTYLRDGARAAEDEAICREVLGPVPFASIRVALPLSARGETEVTVVAAAPGIAKKQLSGAGAMPVVTAAGGFLFVGECRGMVGSPSAPENLALLDNRKGQLLFALSTLGTALRRCASDLARTVRLELYLRDIHFADAARATLRETFGSASPAITIVGADLEQLPEVKLNAIAV